MKKETKVNCEVESCKHNEEKKCSLEELDISCTCDGEECEEIDETICNNFEKNDSDVDENIEELEYNDFVEEKPKEYDEDYSEGEYDNYEDDYDEEGEEESEEEDNDSEDYYEEVTETYIELEEKEEL